MVILSKYTNDSYIIKFFFNKNAYKKQHKDKKDTACQGFKKESPLSKYMTNEFQGLQTVVDNWDYWGLVVLISRRLAGLLICCWIECKRK